MPLTSTAAAPAAVDVVDEITSYALDVVEGRVPAGKYHRLACARHLRDIQHQNTEAFPYWFSIEHARRFFRFAERLKHYKGKWAGQFVRLTPIQKFRLGSLFAWRRRNADGREIRRFRTAYNELPRKQGKSLEAAIVAIYVTFFDSESGAEGYCIATKRDQAKIVFNDCKKLVESTGLSNRIQVRVANLHNLVTASKLEPLGADHDSTDGLNPNLIIVDEFHAHKDRGLIDVMETATGAREQPVMFQITTAGSNPVSPCGDQHDYACKILDGILHDESFFAIICHADAGDDWLDEATWRKANPHYGISVNPDDMRALALKARSMPTAAAAFQQKRLNMWVNTIAPWLSIDGWKQGQTTWSIADLLGKPCWGGVDLSSKIDLTAFVLVFPPDGARKSWRVLLWAFTPGDTLQERAHRDRAPYQVWKDQTTAEDHAVLMTSAGKRINYKDVLTCIAEQKQRFAIQAIGFDPYNAENLQHDLVDEVKFGQNQVVEIAQTYNGMSQASKDFEADVLDGQIDAGDNPLMAWCISNVVVVPDNKDNIYPSKKKSRGRIDPVTATLIARAVHKKIGPTSSDDVGFMVV